METPKKKRLFVCVENSNLSQLSEAFARIHGVGWLKAFSAGSRPSGRINPKAIDSMKQLGYDLSTHRSKSLREVEGYAPFEVVITMGCGDACPWMPATRFVDREIPDPKNLDAEQYQKFRNYMEEKVKELVASLKPSTHE